MRQHTSSWRTSVVGGGKGDKRATKCRLTPFQLSKDKVVYCNKPRLSTVASSIPQNDKIANVSQNYLLTFWLKYAIISVLVATQ